MIVSFDDTYRSEFLLQPARNGYGTLVGIEIVVNFVGAGSVRASAERIVPRLSTDETLTLFTEQLELLESCKLFFIQHQLLAWIHISPVIVDALISNAELAETVAKYPFLEFTVNENYPNLTKGNENNSLVLFSERYPLILGNFGAGAASTRAIFDGLFKRVVLDKNFIHQRLASRSFEPFMRAIVSQISPYCRSVMIDGIDDEKTLKRVKPYQFSAMQGNLWPAVPAAQITSLVQG